MNDKITTYHFSQTIIQGPVEKIVLTKKTPVHNDYEQEFFASSSPSIHLLAPVFLFHPNQLHHFSFG